MIPDASFWTGIGFVIFMVLAGKPVWKLLISALDERASKIKIDIEEAAQLQKEAQDFLNACKREQSEALAKAQKIIQHAQEEAERLRKQSLVEIQQFQANEERLLSERMRQAEEHALKEIRVRAIEIALVSAKKVIAQSLNEDLDQKIYSKILQDIQQINTNILNHPN